MDVMETIVRLAENPEFRLNLEQRGDAYRVRYCRRNGQGMRRGIAVPPDHVEEARRLVHASQQRNLRLREAGRRESREYGEQLRALRVRLDELGRRIYALCPCGRVVRSRVMRGFKRAVALGLEAVEVYVMLRPWECEGGRPGRPEKI